MYTISEVAKLVNLTASTIRYYDGLGLLYPLDRSNGQRSFTQDDIDRLVTIICLKKTGMNMEHIRKFLAIYNTANNTVDAKRSMIESQKKIVEDKMDELLHYIEQCEFKIWFYDNRIIDGVEPPYSKEAFDLWWSDFLEYKKGKEEN